MSSRIHASNTAASLVSIVLAGAISFALPNDAIAGVSGSVALTSDYIFRGISQNNQEPALQAGVEYAADSGFYVGSWGSNVSWLSDTPVVDNDISNSVELDFYGGYRGKFNDTVGFDVGALYYWYPGDYPSGFNSPDTGELYFGISAGVFSAKYSYALTDLFGYADSDGSGYLDAAVNWEFVPTWTLNAHAGKQWIENNEDFEYVDWKLGVTKTFEGGFAIALAYTDTDAEEALYTNVHNNYLGDDTVVLTLTKTF
ncbi:MULTISPECIES: TorF family putative porin [unclassified Lysobacter]|uniref:TorF family putative porin n=1 Tax=unclassified Lysobacter TaxID=2635362 RepID=UPI001C2137F7|nr:TorF family putative porin [Lysobacter sp. MMG2]MBU8977083.1 TorF family putative porin [Lysobacter sp. MMG2]